MLELVSIVTLLSCLVASGGFVVLYGRRSRWRATSVGKSIMLLTGSLLILCLLGVATMIFGPDYPGRDLLRVIGTVLINIALWRQLYVLSRAQKDERGVLAALEAREAREAEDKARLV